MTPPPKLLPTTCLNCTYPLGGARVYRLGTRVETVPAAVWDAVFLLRRCDSEKSLLGLQFQRVSP